MAEKKSQPPSPEPRNPKPGTRPAKSESRNPNPGAPLVGIIMGSDSDLSVMAEAAETLKQFGVPCEVDVTSAHRSPARTSEYARTAIARGLKAIIVGAGGAAHLAGVVAAETTLPVLAVPIASTALQGFDSLLATVQMPAGVPVACLAIGKSGATNAAILAVEILALSDPALAKKLAEHKEKLTRSVAEKSEKVRREFQD